MMSQYKSTLRILFIAPYPIYPTWSGGKIRIAKLAESLATLGHEITLLTPWYLRQRDYFIRQQAQYNTVGKLRLRQVTYPFLWSYLFRDRLLPYSTLTSFHPGYEKLVAPLLNGYDVIHFEQIPFANLVKYVPSGTLVSYGAQNVELDYIGDDCPVKALRCCVEAHTMQLEDLLLNNSDLVFAVCREDENRLRRLYRLTNCSVHIAPNGISSAVVAHNDTSILEHKFPGILLYKRRAIFSGSNVSHNRLAVKNLVDLVINKSPEIGFIIHGSCSTALNIKEIPDNLFVDSSDDINLFYQYASAGTVGLNPITSGSGTNLKLLHYLSYGLPVLSTPFGMRGYQSLAPNVLVKDIECFPQILHDECFPLPPNPNSLLRQYAWIRVAKIISDALLSMRGV